MQAAKAMTANSNFSSVPDIIAALQNILAHSQVTIPDLETPYSKYPNTNKSTTHRGPNLISALISRAPAAVRCRFCTRSQGLETVMDSIKNLHQQLVEKKDKITQSMDLHKGLVSSLWCLPTEVLSQIFDHCLREDISELYPDTLEAPVLLTEVCRRWREVAVGMPSLWCRLYVEVDNNDWQRAAFCYDLWLQRSRGCPLSLELMCCANDSPKLRSLLQPYMNQVTSLSIRFSQDADHAELVLKDFPVLQDLTILVRVNLDISFIAQPISQLPSTVRTLNLIGPFFDIERLSSFNPVWAHLTNIEIIIRYPNAFLYLLQQCPNLSSLKVCTLFDKIPTQEPLIHKQLQSLDINLSSSSPGNLLDALSFPKLRVLKVGHKGAWPHEEFKAFLTRSKCPLESLVLKMMVTEQQRAEYVDLIPSLEVDPRCTYFASH
ncbi:uncharacterized protein EDB91DRAFT_47563 [Suillus paluster]|uniref:uncharacterized protein n=1 Tax=Suillus paluster TaxID=48578 RepID=UPI001B87C22F|nr:uncharacterized protein EDB91DRAFT_47563 [Suillus paluster]KAG1747858.1 hypothetical protein EDB91DRAFT_47563 [Suillus paluster]